MHWNRNPSFLHGNKKAFEKRRNFHLINGIPISSPRVAGVNVPHCAANMARFITKCRKDFVQPILSPALDMNSEQI